MVSLEKLSTKGIKRRVLHTYVSLQKGSFLPDKHLFQSHHIERYTHLKTQPAVNFGPRWSQRELQCAEVMFPSTSLRFMDFHLWAEPKGLMSERFLGRIGLKAHVFFWGGGASIHTIHVCWLCLQPQPEMAIADLTKEMGGDLSDVAYI